MEVYLYNSTVCRLCGEENDNGTFLYSPQENDINLSDTINTYLPIKVSDDGQLPRTLCPGCTIQIEATVEFFNLIVNGQKVIRELHSREKEYKKSLLKTSNDNDVITDKLVYEINTSDGMYQEDHPISLQMAGLERPKRKRGRPAKKQKTPEELAQEAASKQETDVKPTEKPNENDGKRRRKAPSRYSEAVQGKELERIFIEEGVTEGEESDSDKKEDKKALEKLRATNKTPEVIGHSETSGELVMVVTGKGRGRPKGSTRQTHEVCAICGKEFWCVGRYMSHVAQHGPVRLRCAACRATFPTRLAFARHQQDARHHGQEVIHLKTANLEAEEDLQTNEQSMATVEVQDTSQDTDNAVSQDGTEPDAVTVKDVTQTDVEVVTDTDPFEEVVIKEQVAEDAPEEEDEKKEVDGNQPKGKEKLKCNHCDKMFSNKQSKSLHTRAIHFGERPYECSECGAKFAYPRSLTLHTLSHRRSKGRGGYACDLCGKVLSHPSSVVYHKQAAHAGERYVCRACGRAFRHTQLLHRHQLVHSHSRPFHCKTCNSSFKTKANLLNHQLLHTGIKKFSCEICKQKFAHKTSLTLHMRWHSGLKPYACKTCGKRFSQKGNLSEHERIHTGEKPYTCPQCPRRFTTSSQCRLHAARHDRPGALYRPRAHRGGSARARSCAHCPRVFADAASLTKHYKQVHRQVSLLNTSQPAAVLVQEANDAGEAEDGLVSPEHVIYVYDDTAFQLINTEQEAGAGESLLLPPELPELPDQDQQISVNDESGNPLHFTMQDGTRLAITSADGRTLQVITEDGQRIPVEINSYAEDDATEDSQTEHTVTIDKEVESEPASPVTHYFAII